MLTEPIQIDSEGNVALTDKPGLGIELDEDKCRKYEVGYRLPETE